MRIARDPRHQDVTLLQYAAIDAREFASWSMGFAAAPIRCFEAGPVLEPSALTGEQALRLLVALGKVAHEPTVAVPSRPRPAAKDSELLAAP